MATSTLINKLSIATAGAALIALGTGGSVQAAAFQVFNTGVDNNKTVLGNGSVDPHYSLISPSGSAFAINNNPAWLPNDTTSKWIGPRPDADQFTVEQGLFTYRTTFDLTGLDPTTALLSGRFSSDNATTSIKLNDNIFNPVQEFRQFETWDSFAFNSGFVQGLNTLEFTVFNNGTSALTPTASGLRVEITNATAEATGTSKVPESSSMLGILAFGGFGAGSLLKRKQQQKARNFSCN